MITVGFSVGFFYILLFDLLSCSSFFKADDDDTPIKRCPKCKVYIERDEGCAQMMCKNCKHAFCWYCLESLDVSFHSSQSAKNLSFTESSFIHPYFAPVFSVFPKKKKTVTMDSKTCLKGQCF